MVRMGQVTLFSSHQLFGVFLSLCGTVAQVGKNVPALIFRMSVSHFLLVGINESPLATQ